MVQIIVFVDNPTTARQTQIVQWFTSAGYCPLVDAVHKNDYHWFRSQLKRNYRLYNYGSTIYSFMVEDMDEKMHFSPDFAIVFNQDDDEVCDEYWSRIRKYVLDLFTSSNDGVESIEHIMPKPAKITHDDFDLPVIKSADKAADCYGFKTTFDEDRNLMIYQVTRPHTDRPYTTIVRDFKNVGHRPFFSALFVCRSWGVSKYDVPFLSMIWRHLNMDGDFDMDALLKEATEACYPSDNAIPRTEPEVYRRNTDEVMQILNEYEVGKVCQHKDAAPDRVRVRFE